MGHTVFGGVCPKTIGFERVPLYAMIADWLIEGLLMQEPKTSEAEDIEEAAAEADAEAAC